MSVELRRIDDPRDNLQKATRDELEDFAREKGHPEINGRMTADDMRAELRKLGLVNIKIPVRQLGGYTGNTLDDGVDRSVAVAEINAEADLKRQWRDQLAAVPAPKPSSEMTIGELRKECKRLEIKIDRRDNMVALRAKIDAIDKNPA